MYHFKFITVLVLIVFNQKSLRDNRMDHFFFLPLIMLTDMQSKEKQIVILGMVAGLISFAVLIGFIGQGNVRQVPIFWQEKVEQTVVFEDVKGLSVLVQDSKRALEGHLPNREIPPINFLF